MDSSGRNHAWPALYDGVTGQVDEGTAVDVVSLGLSKAFDTLWHNILYTDKLRKDELDGWIVAWIENWPSGRAQRVVIHGIGCSCRYLANSVPRGQYWIQSCSYPSVTLMEGQSAPSASLLMIECWSDWYHRMLCCHSTEMLSRPCS